MMLTDSTKDIVNDYKHQLKPITTIYESTKYSVNLLVLTVNFVFAPFIAEGSNHMVNRSAGT